MLTVCLAGSLVTELSLFSFYLLMLSAGVTGIHSHGQLFIRLPGILNPFLMLASSPFACSGVDGVSVLPGSCHR